MLARDTFLAPYLRVSAMDAHWFDVWRLNAWNGQSPLSVELSRIRLLVEPRAGLRIGGDL